MVRHGLLERAGRNDFRELQLVFDGDVVPLDEDRRAFDTGHGPDHAIPRRCPSLAGRFHDFTREESCESFRNARVGERYTLVYRWQTPVAGPRFRLPFLFGARRISYRAPQEQSTSHSPSAVRFATDLPSEFLDILTAEETPPLPRLAFLVL